MTLEQFIQEVISQAPDKAKPHGRKAAQHVFDISKDRVYKPEIAKAVVLAAEFASLEPEPVETFKLRPHPDDLIRQGQVLQKLTPHMKVIRTALFGVETGPFSSRKEAQNWIELTANEEDPRRHPRFGFCACGKLVIHDKRCKWAMRIRHLKYEAVVLDSGKVTVKSVKVADLRPFRFSKLSQIESHTKQWAHASGFDQWSLVTWLLTDIEPKRDALVLEVRRHSTPFLAGVPFLGDDDGIEEVDFPDHYWATITVNSLHVGAKQWTALRRRLREYLGINKAKPLTGKDQAFLKAISRLGGVPQRHGRKMQFWEQLFQECGSQFPSWRSAHAPRLQYGRITDKLEAASSFRGNKAP